MTPNTTWWKVDIVVMFIYVCFMGVGHVYVVCMQGCSKKNRWCVFVCCGIASQTPWQPRFTANLTKSLIVQSASPYWWGFTGHTNTASPEIVCAGGTTFTFLSMKPSQIKAIKRETRLSTHTLFNVHMGIWIWRKTLTQRQGWNNRINRTITNSFSANFLKNAIQA